MSEALLNQELDKQYPCALLANLLMKRRWMLATAESCTGGLVAAACTELPGSSRWFERGWVTYSNTAKYELLGVHPLLIEDHGAVSEVVARAMAAGAARRSRALATLAVTGIAGPDGGSDDKPVGSVWFAWCLDGRLSSELRQFQGDRAAVRAQAADHALARLQALLVA